VFCSSYLARVSEWFGNAARFHVPLVGANSEPDWELARPNAGALVGGLRLWLEPDPQATSLPAGHRQRA
jgi:hypothetical protein